MRGTITRLFGKYRLMYILIWMIVSFIITFINYDIHTSVLPQWIGYLILTATAIPVSYYAAYKLTPRYLYRRKVGTFISFLLIFAILNSIVSFFLTITIYSLITGNPIFRSLLYLFSLFFETLLIDIILIAISCMIKIIIDRYFMEQQLFEIEKEKVS